jgi:hypothetical protein
MYIHSLFICSFPFYLFYFAFCANSFLLFSFLTVELSLFPLCPWDLHKTYELIIILCMEICNSRFFLFFYFYCIINFFFQIKKVNYPPQVMNELEIIIVIFYDASWKIKKQPISTYLHQIFGCNAPGLLHLR